MTTRIYLCAGESSGDLHGAHLVTALRNADPDVICEGIGGPRMAQAGMRLHFDLASMAIMGFVEVLRRLWFIRNLFERTVGELRRDRPNCLVLIDYPGFNLRLAERAHAMQIPVVYYISPQVWAWKAGRIKTIARVVKKMLVILPFEETLYHNAGVDCTYVGHPLLDHLAAIEFKGVFAGTMIIGLMPGSREQEIRRILPVMIEIAEGVRARFPEARFVVPCVDADREDQIKELAGEFPLEIAVGGAYELLSAARFCLVASGTATVEAAVFGVPMIVLYRVAPVTYWLAKRLVRVEHIGMVNILAGRRIVPEFLQTDATVDQVLPAALDLIADGPIRETMKQELAKVKTSLGQAGASKRAAEAILRVAREGSHG